MCYPIGFDIDIKNPASDPVNGPLILRAAGASIGSKKEKRNEGCMNSLTSAVILGYAGLLVLGGIIGWRVSGSRISLTSSLISAALLAVAYRISLTRPIAGQAMATLVAAALAVLFAFRLRKTKKFMPSGMMLIVSGIVMVILAWCTIQAWPR